MQKLLIIVFAMSFMSATMASAYEEYEDKTPLESYYMVIDDGAFILDVRTDAEFIWVGHPKVPNVVNISYEIEKNKELIVNPSFISDVNDIFEDVKDTPIIVMCRSGVRSVKAALALYAAGYTNVFNMADGFEGGDKDQYGYRTINGWKNSGLPGHTSSVGADDVYPD